MAQIELSASFPSVHPTEYTIERLCQLAETEGFKVSRVAPNQADFRRGSQAALRLKGGLIAKIGDFPVVAAVRCDPALSGCTVVIHSLDDLGFGLKFGMRKKYTEAVRTFGETLAGMVGYINSNG